MQGGKGLQFAVLFGGVFFSRVFESLNITADLVEDWKAGPLKIPSVHVIGQRDPVREVPFRLIAASACRTALSSYSNLTAEFPASVVPPCDKLIAVRCCTLLTACNCNTSFPFLPSLTWHTDTFLLLQAQAV